MQVKLTDGSISNDLPTVETEFSNLFNSNIDHDERIDLNDRNTEMNHAAFNNAELNGYNTRDELVKTIQNAGSNKAPGCDEIPTEVLKNETTMYFMLRLFNVCLQTGQVPKEWSKCILNPIPRSSTNDRTDPMSYRGIALAAASYKLYNNRLIKWAESNERLANEQNGFRKGRSTIDHISSITNIIETRKLKRKQTFAAFIDFRKAYDSINRSLSTLGKTGQFRHRWEYFKSDKVNLQRFSILRSA